MEFKRIRYGVGIDDISDSKGKEEKDSDMHISNINPSLTDKEMNLEIEEKIDFIKKLFREKSILA